MGRGGGLAAGGGWVEEGCLWSAVCIGSVVSRLAWLLFEVFMHILEEHSGDNIMPTVWSAIPLIILDILK